MRGTAGAFLQSCLILLVRADQWRLKDSAGCDLNRKVSSFCFLLFSQRDSAQVRLLLSASCSSTLIQDQSLTCI